ncbi:hypothetical protein V8E36_003344 [Tilletia maclaganii]
MTQASPASLINQQNRRPDLRSPAHHCLLPSGPSMTANTARSRAPTPWITPRQQLQSGRSLRQSQPQAPSPSAGEEAGPGELPTAADVYQALLFARPDLENAAVRAVRAVQSVGTAQASEPFVDDGLSSGDESEDDLLEELESEDDDDSELDSEENGDGSGSEESYYDTETDVEGANREEDGTRRVAPASTSAKGAAALNQANIIPPPPSYHSPP